MLDGAWPRTDNLVSLSDAGGVLVDWLATGRGPKTRAALRELQQRAAEPSSAYRVGPDRQCLQRAIAMAEEAARIIPEPMSIDRRVELILAFYDRLTEQSHD